MNTEYFSKLSSAVRSSMPNLASSATNTSATSSPPSPPSSATTENLPPPPILQSSIPKDEVGVLENIPLDDSPAPPAPEPLRAHTPPPPPPPPTIPPPVIPGTTTTTTNTWVVLDDDFTLGRDTPCPESPSSQQSSARKAHIPVLSAAGINFDASRVDHIFENASLGSPTSARSADSGTPSLLGHLSPSPFSVMRKQQERGLQDSVELGSEGSDGVLFDGEISPASSSRDFHNMTPPPGPSTMAQDALSFPNSATLPTWVPSHLEVIAEGVSEASATPDPLPAMLLLPPPPSSSLEAEMIPTELPFEMPNSAEEEKTETSPDIQASPARSIEVSSPNSPQTLLCERPNLGAMGMEENAFSPASIPSVENGGSEESPLLSSYSLSGMTNKIGLNSPDMFEARRSLSAYELSSSAVPGIRSSRRSGTRDSFSTFEHRSTSLSTTSFVSGTGGSNTRANNGDDHGDAEEDLLPLPSAKLASCCAGMEGDEEVDCCCCGSTSGGKGIGQQTSSRKKSLDDSSDSGNGSFSDDHALYDDIFSLGKISSYFGFQKLGTLVTIWAYVAFGQCSIRSVMPVLISHTLAVMLGVFIGRRSMMLSQDSSHSTGSSSSGASASSSSATSSPNAGASPANASA